MAKTNRRPVDRLERQARLERRSSRFNDDDEGFISARNWNQYTDTDQDELDEALDPIAA